MTEHEITIWRAALEAAAAEAEGFLLAEGNARDVAARIRGLVPTPTVIPKWPLSARAKQEYARQELERGERVAREVNASNHLAGVDSHLVVARADLESVRKVLRDVPASTATKKLLAQLARILDGSHGERASAGKKLCGVPSLTLGPCDLAAGHKGEMHSSLGDGFYASKTKWPSPFVLSSAKKRGGR